MIYNDTIKKQLDIAISLYMVDVKRCLFENLRDARYAFNFNILQSQGSLNFIVGGLSLFTLTGLSFRIANRFKRYIQKRIFKKESQISLLSFTLAKFEYDYLIGNWNETFDEKYLNESYGEGELIYPTALLLFFGYFKIETADFKTCNHIINKHATIGREYNFLHAQSDVFVLKSKLSMKIRKSENAISNVEKGITSSLKEGWEAREVELLGIKARLHMIDDDCDKAKKAFIKTQRIINKIGATSIFIPWLSDYYIGSFDYNVQNLAKAVKENDLINISKLKEATKKSGKIAVKHSKKVASDRTETFKLMGTYYWLINNQKKALKWWTKSIKTGEQLGAKIELSRAYFEVGKNLQSPQSKYKELNGITAQEYLNKAKTMFEEMDLAWDLNELEKVSTYN